MSDFYTRFLVISPFYQEFNHFLAEMTRDWLQNHNIDDASEIISYNNELETQLTRAKSEKDELSILNENLSEKCDMLTSQNSQLKAQLHG